MFLLSGLFFVCAFPVLLFLLFGRGACFIFCCLGGSFFLLFGRVRVHFLLFGRLSCFLFAVWAGGGRAFFLLFGWGTGVHSLTGLPGSSSSDPTTKKTKQQKKKNTGSIKKYTPNPGFHKSVKPFLTCAWQGGKAWKRKCKLGNYLGLPRNF